MSNEFLNPSRNDQTMSGRRETVVRAAVAVFSRYGVKRATMNDIAGEAGVARQTLYNLFADKDDLLRAAVRLYANNACATIEAECAGVSDLGDRLDVVFHHLVVVPWERIHATPHGDEILTGIRAAARQEVALAEVRYGAMLEAMLTPYGGQLSETGLSPGRVSDLLQASWYGIRHKAKDREHLLGLLASLKAVALDAAKVR